MERLLLGRTWVKAFQMGELRIDERGQEKARGREFPYLLGVHYQVAKT